MSTVSGKVVAPSSPGGLAGVHVEVQKQVTGDDGVVRWEGIVGANGISGSDGSFSVGSVSAGSYRIEAFGLDDHSGATKAFTAGSSAVSVSTLTVTPCGSVSGRVTDASGADLEGARVEATPVGGGSSFATHTTSAGTYSLPGLPAGSYSIRLEDELGRTLAARTLPAAVTVMSAADTPLGTVQLPRGGTISGTIKGTSGGGVDGAVVDVYRVVDGRVDTSRTVMAQAGESGTFRVGGLATGTYKVQVTDTTDLELLEFYDNSGGLDGARDVDVVEGSDTSVGTILLDVAGTVPPAATPAPPATAAGKKLPTVKVKGKGGKRKATLVITVTAPGVIPTGSVTVKQGASVKKKALKAGRATVTLKKQKKGKRTYKVSYSGDAAVAGSSASTKVKVT